MKFESKAEIAFSLRRRSGLHVLSVDTSEPHPAGSQVTNRLQDGPLLTTSVYAFVLPVRLSQVPPAWIDNPLIFDRAKRRAP
ncbi:hypothetical protein OKW28_002893 [Paraburkholderia sp. 40]